MINVTLFLRTADPQCEQIRQDLEAIQAEIPHRLVVVDIENDPVLMQSYATQVPIVQVGPYRLQAPITRQELLVALGAARDRHQHLTQLDDEVYRKRLKQGRTISGADSFSYWLSHHYMLLFNLVVFLYVGLPFLAPALLKVGVTGPANIIYTIYSPLCHQLTFRSWFLFGEQAYYPRQLAGLTAPLTYEEISGSQEIDVLAARNFLGNEVLGYKVALCQRDVAIYGAILLFGLIFAATGRRIKSFPWYIWLAAALIPMGLDGFSQLPSLMGDTFAWAPMRESTPLLRTITGFLFGFPTAWYLYPLIEEAMADTRRVMAQKFAVVQRLGPVE